MALTLNSPGVQLNEVDLTLKPVIPTGTSVLVLGFASQGPTDEVIQVANFGDFQTIFGTPTNAAERYFYYTVKTLFNSSANVNVGRLPYGAGSGSGFGNTYTALVYPVVPVSPSLSSVSLSAGYLSAASLSATTQGYIVGEPTQFSLQESDYNSLASGQIGWSDLINLNTPITNVSEFGQAGIIVLNTARTTIDNMYQGYYIGIQDNTYINPTTDYTSIENVYSVNQANGTNFVTVPTNRLNFTLSAAHTGTAGSISQTLENITPFDVSGSGFVDTLLVGVFKLGTSIYNPNTISLNYNLVESYTGSLDSTRRVNNTSGGAPLTFFLGDVESKSPNIEILINPSISRVNGSWANNQGNPTKYVQTYKTTGTTDPNINYAVGTVISKMDALFPLGSYSAIDSTTLTIGAVPSKVDRLLNLVSNIDAVQIDITVEAGLGTVYVASRNCATLSAANSFDDTAYLNLSGASGGFFYPNQGLIDSNALAIQADYESVQNEFINFAQNIRKDHIYISDPIRHIFVQGANTKVLDILTNTFSLNVYWPLKHLYENLNTTYGASYEDWLLTYDGVTDSQFWLPPSGQLAMLYAQTDAKFYPWIAPAGFTRGIVQNVNDISIVPQQKDRDMLYKIGLNSITQFPDQGFIVMGQKTLYKVPSAFDRVNVRRLFLFLEKATYATAKFFVFEPNTVITRNRVINNLTPIFELAKATQGIYDYLIVCDERNNTPAVIDANELVVDVYIKPVRAAEFILVNFYATQTSQDFTEITG